MLTVEILTTTPLDAWAQTTATLTTLYNFQPSDGSSPAVGLAAGRDGNFYGTTPNGGANGQGTVYQVTPAGVLTTLHSFSGSDGANPSGTLVQGIYDDGFYGLAASGGTDSDGLVYRITSAGAVTTVHDFGGPEGAAPLGGLVAGRDGTFYGETASGGTNSTGTVFQLAPDGTLIVLLSDAPVYTSSGLAGGLVLDNNGNLYGLYSSGTLTINGTIDTYSLDQFTPAGADDTSLSLFSSPPSTVTLGENGNFYGTNYSGGANGDGTVFQLTLSGVFTTIYSFNGADGSHPGTALLLGADGNFYGTTTADEAGNDTGTLFRITPLGVLTTLYRFSGGSDGGNPNSMLVEGTDGSLYGTTSSGGANSMGTIFKLSVPVAITSALTATAQVGTPFTYQITATGSAITYAAGSVYSSTSGLTTPLPDGLSLDPATGIISGTPTREGDYVLAIQATNTTGSDLTQMRLTIATSGGQSYSAFFTGEEPLSNGVYYLQFFYSGEPNRFFSYYSHLSDPHYIYHFDLGFEYVFDANDGKSGAYFYDFASGTFFYTSPVFPFPYLYDFTLNSVLYYYPDPNNAGRYNMDGIRYFYDFNTGQIITK